MANDIGLAIDTNSIKNGTLVYGCSRTGIFQTKNTNVWATGSRIYGTWRTKEEEDIISKANNKKPKYSDYDYCTNAKNIPPLKVFMQELGVKTDFSDCNSDKKVLL